MTVLSVLLPFRSFRRRHVALMRQVAVIHHRQLDQSTLLGYLWSFLNPLLTLAVVWIFFNRSQGQLIPQYALHLLVGIVLFTHFSKSTSAAMRVIHRMRSLAVNVIFPKDLLIYSVLLANAPEFLISIGLTLLAALAGGAPASPALLAVPLVLAGQVALVLWTSMTLAMIYVFVRDLDHLFEVGMRLLFFVTPIIYSLDSLSPQLRAVAQLNPLAQGMELMRTIVIAGQVPAAGVLFSFVVINLVLAYASVVVFRLAEPAVLERL